MPRKKESSEVRKTETKVKKTGVKVKTITLDEVYRLINRVQVNRKEVHFLLSQEDSVIANNVLRDLDLKYDIKDFKGKVQFTIYPKPEEEGEEKSVNIEVDFFADEIPESGQLF